MMGDIDDDLKAIVIAIHAKGFTNNFIIAFTSDVS